MSTRRKFIDMLGRLGLGGSVAPLAACGSLRHVQWPASEEHFDLVVIGSGFGGTMTALTVAYTMEARLAAARPPATPLRILMLERGTWWTTPTETIQDKQVKTREFLIAKGQPTQEWSSLADYRGMLDLLRRCRYSPSRPQGLFDFAPIGKHGLFNLHNDGISVLRASGVGGGSLVYSKILMRPPEILFDDPRWPAAWRGSAGAAQRGRYYRRALQAVTQGVETLMPGKDKAATGLTGPSNILTRAPGWALPKSVQQVARFDSDRKLLRIAVGDARAIKDNEGELIDRARVFQTAVGQLKPAVYGAVDLSINDMDIGGSRAQKPVGTNVCERHGRCNVGCLPGAGQTLNKQLQRAIYGTFDTKSLEPGAPADGQCVLRHVALQLRALAQVDHVSESADGSYRVHYLQRSAADPAVTAQPQVVTASRVVFAAGSLGTTELLLRSRQRSEESEGARGLHALSDKLGDGFASNGDHIAFLAETKERVNLTYGPVTTSFAWFRTDSPQGKEFHNVEDQGVPRSLSALTGHGVEVMNRLAQGDGLERWIEALGNGLKALNDIFASAPTRTYGATGAADLSADRPEAEDELTARLMCVVAQGKDAADGRLRLEDDRLRASRPNQQRFVDDPIFRTIEGTLDKLAQQLRPPGSQARFISPLSDGALPGVKPVVLTSHPLGGCPMGESVAAGVVDETGRVYRKDSAPRAVYRGLYVADGSMLPTSLGVNPALTISAVALRVADQMIGEWDAIAARTPRAAVPLQCA